MSTLSIDKCPIHGYWAVSVNEESFGRRVTPGKCCGRWDTVRQWKLSKREWKELANLASEAANSPA